VQYRDGAARAYPPTHGRHSLAHRGHCVGVRARYSHPGCAPRAGRCNPPLPAAPGSRFSPRTNDATTSHIPAFGRGLARAPAHTAFQSLRGRCGDTAVGLRGATTRRGRAALRFWPHPVDRREGRRCPHRHSSRWSRTR
jgi:hypothetical protein